MAAFTFVFSGFAEEKVNAAILDVVIADYALCSDAGEDDFTDTKRVTQSHVPAANIPVRLNVPEEHSMGIAANESKVRQKHSRPIEIINDNELEPRTVEECQYRNDWPKWKEAIQAELDLLAKRKVFGPVVQTHENVKPVGYKWVFVCKRNEMNEIVRYKARLVV
ncbi:uncharacterized protein LOC131148738 [Malania oleifera]|uniref:uncharacterized protein LOC131148738 n=1 Tax=Malania oleifera TaxID=397392 RepID=UPI0025AE818D|nr:uncharacterized protein LOC131148738 [Malania oleifera]